MHTTSEQTVREIARANPASVRVFEALGIDYCCGGNLSLSAACSRADVPLENVIASLQECTAPVMEDALSDAPLGELTRHIVDRHHAFVRRESPRIARLLDKVCDKHGQTRSELSDLKTLFATLTKDLAEHVIKEERILFPYIQALSDGTAPSACFSSVAGPISVMIADHEDAGAILSKMRVLSQGYKPPEGACATFYALYQAMEEFERDLHRHVHLENDILFPRAIEAERERNTLLSAC